MYIKDWRRKDSAAVNLALYSSDSSSDCNEQPRMETVESVMASPSCREDELDDKMETVMFDVPDYVDSSESEYESRF